MHQLKVKFVKNSDAQSDNLLKTLCRFKIKFSKIDHNRNVCFVYCNNDRDTDTIFSEPCVTALESFGFTANMPLELKVKRSIVIKNIDKFICEQPQEELINELN